ncbi:3'-5' exonuclease [Trichloromonas sp.]|mgnify:CR=1 FL=1|uniref:3'-5' exonuclease n=1 Tax=Trichloromonas sp. TaxID=3069249 RepID=UPI002A3A8760|nr:3'-5' exonuclease [Trichloromonas sp.]
MDKIIKFSDFLLEHKLWYKTIPQFLNWLEEKSKSKDFVFVDTETTGLGGPKKVQLTQIAAISTIYDFHQNDFKEQSSFNQKIKLTEETLKKKTEKDSKINWVLSFNRYGEKGIDYIDEEVVLSNFYNWVEEQKDAMLVIQNAEFDMNLLNMRSKNIKFNNEVFDTKQLIQLYYIPLIQKLSETDDNYKELINKIGTSTRDNGLISSSMSKIGPALGLNMSGYHDALSDCRITTNMVVKIIDLLKEHSDVDIMKYQSERIKMIRNN